MAATDVTRAPAGATNQRSTGIRRITETKAAITTTEFMSFVAVLVGLLIAGAVTKAGEGADDRLLAKHVWLYVTILTVGYMISRGLAKSGVREPYTEDNDR